MKNLKYFFVMLITVVAFTSCDLVKTDVTFDHTYKSDLDINIPSGAKSVDFDVNTILDPYSSEEYAQYADLIKDINVNGIAGLIATINKTVTITNFELMMESLAEGAQVPESVQFSKQSITFEEGATITFEENADEFQTISNWLMNKQEITINITGTSSEDDVQAKFRTETGISVTADPLK